MSLNITDIAKLLKSEICLLTINTAIPDHRPPDLMLMMLDIYFFLVLRTTLLRKDHFLRFTDEDYVAPRG